MATLRTVTVKISGGDYTSLSSAVATECTSVNLVSLDRQLDIVCDAILDTTRVTIPSTCTTDATRYVRIVGPAHLGVVANAYRLHPTADFNKAFTIQTAYVHLVDISVQHESTAGNTSNGDSAVYYDPPSATAQLLLDKLLCLKSAHQGVIVAQGVIKAKNSAVVASTTAMEIGDNTGSSLSTYVYNCVLKGGTGAGLEKLGNGTTQATNCYAASDSTSAYLQSTGTLTRTTCASDDATGSAGLQSITYSTANFTNVTAGTENFQLVTGSSLIRSGTDLSADAALPFSTDMYGDTRTAPWDVGVDQTPPAPIITVQPVQQTVASGATATFSVTATGATSYQWQVNSSGTWANVSTGSGGTTSSYTTGTLGTSDIGSLFRCQVTNAAGTVNTAEVFVFLTNQPSAGKGERSFGSAWARRTTRRTGNIRSRTVGFIRTRANRTPSKDNSALTTVWFNWFFPAATSTTPNGTLAKTNLSDTSAGQATTTVVSSLARTNTNDTSAVSVTTTVLSTLARTNQNDTSAATGNTWPSSTLAETNANDTLAASGSVGAAVTSTLAVTNANDTSAVQVTTTIVSSLAKTNQNDTASASVDTTVVTSLARTNANDTSSGVGTTTILSTLAVTNGNDTINASGSVGSAVSSSLAVTNLNDTLSSTGSTTILSTLTFTNQNDTSSISGTTSPNATLSKTNGDDTLVASGTSGFPAAGIGTKLPLTGVGG